MKTTVHIFLFLTMAPHCVSAMNHNNGKMSSLMSTVSQTLSGTCLFKTVLLECCAPGNESTEEVIEICSQQQKIISNYKAIEQEPLEKGWKGYKLVGMEFGGPMQTAKSLNDSDEIAPIYELDMNESIHLDLERDNFPKNKS